LARDPALAKSFPDAPVNKGNKAEELITFVKDRPGHDYRYAIDAAKIKTELGYSPSESFATGIRKTIDWYLENRTWWLRVMDGEYRQWISKHYAD